MITFVAIFLHLQESKGLARSDDWGGRCTIEPRHLYFEGFWFAQIHEILFRNPISVGLRVKRRVEVWILCNDNESITTDVEMVSTPKWRHRAFESSTFEGIGETHKVKSAFPAMDASWRFPEQSSEDRVPFLGYVAIPVTDKGGIVDFGSRMQPGFVFRVVKATISIRFASNSNSGHAILNMIQLNAGHGSRHRASCVGLARIVEISYYEARVTIVAFLQPYKLGGAKPPWFAGFDICTDYGLFATSKVVDNNLSRLAMRIERVH